MIRSGALGPVARRVVGLFVACALLPVAAAIALSYGRVNDVLLEQRTEQLRDAAESYSTSLLERLSVAELLAQSVAESAEPDHALPGRAQRDGFFRAALLAGAEPKVLFGRPARVPDAREIASLEAHLATGASGMIVPHPGETPRSVWLVHAGLSKVEGQQYFLLEVNPRYLWGASDELPYQTDICVFDAQREPLYCTRPLSPAGLAVFRERIAAEPKGTLSWQADGVRYLSGYRELFLRGKLGTGTWSIVASQPEDYALAPVRSLTKLVVPVVALGLLVAAFLGLVQVRRTLGPLKELTDATARIAGRDFGARVPAHRDDEFGALGRAFNAMSATLGRQFHALEAHAEIDAVILSNVDVTQVAGIVLRRMAQVARADQRLLLLADGVRRGTYRVHSADAPGGLEGHDATLSEAEAGRLLSVSGEAEEFRNSALPALGIRRAFAVPIVVGGELAGALVLGYDDDRRPDADEASHLRDLADRVAVALSTAQRDRELHRRAHYDALTQLPNRLLGLEELARAVAAAERQRRTLAVLFVDLDGFSAVNDSMGHVTGDELLVQVAGRLRHCVRKADIVARLGGDEFAIVLPEIHGAADAALVATHVIEALSKPFDLRPSQAFISASVGIALYPGDGTTGEDLLRHADLAMYSAKQKGRSQSAFFEASMNEEVQRRLTLERDLRQALRQGQFELYYQPQLELASGRIIGAEALIRWIHPERGIVPPGEFIGFAEGSPLIEDIGRWALGAACAQLAAWRADGLGIDHVSVNVSPRQLRDPGFATVVADALRSHGLPEGTLRLEITETAVIDQGSEVNANLASLTGLGVPLELDDFGTGYSSLAYLQRLPVATVKLDLALIRTIETNANDRAVVRAAVDMVHALGKSVLAEGVETAGQLEILAGMGCNAVQGYYVGRPLAAARFAQLVRDHVSEGRAAA